MLDFNPEMKTKLKKYILGQFSDWYTPSNKNVDNFINWFLKDMHKNYDMPLDISFDELLRDWELDEPFNEWFLD